MYIVTLILFTFFQILKNILKKADFLIKVFNLEMSVGRKQRSMSILLTFLSLGVMLSL